MNSHFAPQPQRLSRWIVVLAVLLSVITVCSFAVVLANRESNTLPAAAPPIIKSAPPGSIEESLEVLRSRKLDQLPPETRKTIPALKQRLIGSNAPGFQEQEDTVIRDYAYQLDDPKYFDNVNWRTFPQPTPGMSLNIDGEFACTLGFIGRYMDDTDDATSDEYASLTAGHCMQNDDDGEVKWSPGENGDPVLPLGVWDSNQALGERFVEQGYLSRRFPGHPAPEALPKELDTDYSVFSLNDGMHPDPRINARYKVVTTAGAADIRPGMEICKFGFRTGETCGRVISWNDSMVRVNLYSLTGDSGSPAYIRLGDDKVAALGVLSSSPVNTKGDTNDYITDFALAEPAMRATGFRLI